MTSTLAPDFRSCLCFLQWWTTMWKYKPNIPFSPQLTFWSWCFITAIETLRHHHYQGIPQEDQNAYGSVKGIENNHSWYGFRVLYPLLQEMLFFHCLYCGRLLIMIAWHITSDWTKHSYHQGLYVEEMHKERREKCRRYQQASCQLPTLLQNSVSWHLGMLRSTVCHAFYLESQCTR